MSDVLLPLAVLACPVGMGVMMFVMMRGMGGRGGHPPDESATVADLRAERDRLARQLEQSEGRDREPAADR